MSPPAFEDGAVGQVSTTGDLLAFSRMLLADEAGLLSPDLIRAMTDDQLTPSQKAAGAGFPRRCIMGLLPRHSTAAHLAGSGD